MKATELLKKQHREVKALFRRAKKADPAERREIMDEIAEQLAHHMRIEEEIFYPALHDLGTKKVETMVPEAYEEHHVVALVLGELPEVDPEDERFEAKMTVLDELVQHHVDEEEKEMFQAAEKLGAERLKELAAEMEAMPRGGAAEEAEDEEDDEDDEADDDELQAGAEDDYEDDDELEDDELEHEDDDEASATPAARARRGERA